MRLDLRLGALKPWAPVAVLMPFMGIENSHSLYCVLMSERRDSEVQSHLLGLCWPHLFGSWDGSELGSALAALKGASAEQMGCLRTPPS